MVEQTEVWRPVSLFDGSFFGLYEVSDQGRVRRCGGSGGRTPASRALKPNANWGGYLMVSLSSPARSEHPAVHRLVADAFLGPRPDGLQVHHCNGLKDDNRACNLRYVTPSDNCKHRCEVLGKGRGEDHYRCKFSDAEIETVRTLYAHGVSQKKIAAKFNVRQSWVSAVVNNQTRCPLGEEARFPGRETERSSRLLKNA